MDNIRERLISVFETNGFFLPGNLSNSDVNTTGFDVSSDKEIINSEMFPDINIADFDISSLDLISIIIGIEDEFGFNIPDEKLSLELFNSLNGLVEFVTDIVQNQKKSVE